MTDESPKWIYNLIFFMMLSSSFVLIEPSPYDFFMLLIVCCGLFFSLIKFPNEVFIPLLFILLFLIFQFISLLFAKETNMSFTYLAITCYLMISWFVIVGIGPKLKISLLQVVMKGYLISAVISAAIGILAYFNLLPFSDFLVMYGRAKAFFKDPNVFGPFLIMPALYVFSLFEKEQAAKYKILYALSFLLLLTAIFVSFSRAAWGNWALSFIIYFLLTKRELLQKRLKTIISLSVLSIPVLVWLTQSPFVVELFQARLSMQGYDESRFATQKEALVIGLKNPFGIGPGQSEYFFQMAPHSLYARIIIENGIWSVVLFIFFILLSINKSYHSYKQSIDESAVYFLIICASLIGLTFNSFFIDTLHWRHFWLLLSLAWCAPQIRGDDG